MREIEGHFYLEQFLLFWRLISEGLFVEGEANDDCLDGRSFLVHLFVFLELFRGLSLQFDVAEESILRNDDIQVILLHAEHFHLHDHVSL